MSFLINSLFVILLFLYFYIIDFDTMNISPYLIIYFLFWITAMFYINKKIKK